MAAKTLEDRKRLQKKYWTDVAINPLKVIFLILPTFLVAMSASPILIAAVITLGCLGFMIAETIHCKAHIDGAFEKSTKEDRHNKYKAWLPLKVGITSLRLTASLTGALMLAMASIFASAGIFSPLIPAITIVYIAAFITSSAFSTAHKVRGLDSLGKKNASRIGLFVRAFIGVVGLVLSILVMLKPPDLMDFLKSPEMVIFVPIASGLILIGMLIAKVNKARSNERAIEKMKKEGDKSELFDADSAERESLISKHELEDGNAISLDRLSVSSFDDETPVSSPSVSPSSLSDSSLEGSEPDLEKEPLLLRIKSKESSSSPDITPTSVSSLPRPRSSSFEYSASQTFLAPPTPKSPVNNKSEKELDGSQLEARTQDDASAMQQSF